MAPAFHIAQAVTVDDLVAARALFEAYQASLAVDLCFQGFSAELTGLPGKYAPPKGALLLARDGNGCAQGCVALRPVEAPSACEMKRLWVEPTARGTGLGRRLLEAVLGEARRIGYSEIWLDTLPDMTAAQALYRAAGFERAEPYYDTPIQGTVFMRLGLS